MILNLKEARFTQINFLQKLGLSKICNVFNTQMPPRSAYQMKQGRSAPYPEKRDFKERPSFPVEKKENMCYDKRTKEEKE